MKKNITVLILSILFLACGSRSLQETVMDGFEDGSLRMKYSSKIAATTLKNGKKGYLLETHTTYSVGDMDRLETKKSTVMKLDFTLHSVEKTRVRNEATTETRYSLENGQILFWIKQGDQPPAEQTVPVEGPVFSDVHPLLYSRDLTEPGSEKAYPVFDEASLTIKQMTVKFVGPKNLIQEGKPTPSLHFQLENIGNPGMFSDYFLDPKTKRIIKIETETLEFLPAA